VTLLDGSVRLADLGEWEGPLDLQLEAPSADQGAVFIRRFRGPGGNAAQSGPSMPAARRLSRPISPSATPSQLFRNHRGHSYPLSGVCSPTITNYAYLLGLGMRESSRAGHPDA
jgi:hypothetical protein